MKMTGDARAWSLSHSSVALPVLSLYLSLSLPDQSLQIWAFLFCTPPPMVRYHLLPCQSTAAHDFESPPPPLLCTWGVEFQLLPVSQEFL